MLVSLKQEDVNQSLVEMSWRLVHENLTVTQITAVELPYIYKLLKLLRPTPNLRKFYDVHLCLICRLNTTPQSRD